jgi:CopG family transcriptional regulator, nickel-responsive regulator
MGGEMSGLTRFGVSIPNSLLKDFDRLIGQKGYHNRSEAIRDLIRDSLVKEEWREGKQEMVGTVALVYSHHTRELSRLLTRMQHDHYKTILSTLHIHLDEHNCLEVLVVKGKGGDIKSISDRLIGIRGVKHGKLSLTTTGKNLR